MVDYKEMYFNLFRASEHAISNLIQAQRECEEMYVSKVETELTVIPIASKNNKSMEEE